MTYTQEFIEFVSSAAKYNQKAAFLGVTSESLNPDETSCLEKTQSFVRAFNRFPSEKWFSEECELPLADTKDPFDYYKDRLYKRAVYKVLAPVIQEASVALRDRDPLAAADLIGKALDKQRDIFKSTQLGGWQTTSELVGSLVEEYSKNKLGSGVRGVPTGWEFVDGVMGGHQKGDLNTIAARPGTGKTYILLKMAYSAWKADFKVLFVSMEMAKAAIIKRLVGISTSNNPEHFKKREVSNMFLDFISKGELTLNGSFVIADSGDIRGTAALDSAIEMLQPDIVFVDSSYLMTPQRKQGSNAGRRDIIAAVAEDLKAIAVKRNIPVVQSMQLNRQTKIKQTKEDGDPLSKMGLENIAEADVIGQLSSVVIGLGKPSESTEEVRYMRFLKGREGEQGTCKIKYEFNPVNFDFIEVVGDFDGLTNDQENDITDDDLTESSV